jgi:predicted  nucleic acid-binding Zn-ribbon protein
MSQTLNLYRLQQIDNQIDRIRTRMQDIQSLLNDDTELRNLNEQVSEATARVESSEKALKLEQTQSSLYGTKSHSPKELQDLQNDVAALKRYLITLEDRQIDAMQESETADFAQQAARAKLCSAIESRAGVSKDLCQENNVLKIDLDRFLVERNAVIGAVPATESDLYNQLRQQRRGVAVAIISDNSCGACGSNLSLAQIQSARSAGQMTLCPSCGRILYGS